MTLTGFTEIEPTVEQPISPTEELSDEELAHQFSQALNKDIYEAEELHEKILSEAKAGPWSQVQPRKTKAPVRLLPEEQLVNLFPEHSKKQIDKALIECGTVDDSAIYLMSKFHKNSCRISDQLVVQIKFSKNCRAMGI